MVGKTNNPDGRPSKFTPAIRKELLDFLKSEVPYEIAARACGIAEETLLDWLKKGDNHNEQGIESDFSLFSRSVRKLTALNIKSHLDAVKDEESKYKGRQWILERHPLSRGHFASVQEKRVDDLENMFKKSIDEIKEAQAKYIKEI